MLSRVRPAITLVVIIICIVLIFSPPVFAANDGSAVSSAIEQTWKSAGKQIKTVTENVIFPVIDCVLAIMLFVKLSTSYFEYKKHGDFEFTPVAIIFFGLIFALTAPLYIWGIVGL